MYEAAGFVYEHGADLNFIHYPAISYIAAEDAVRYANYYLILPWTMEMSKPHIIVLSKGTELVRFPSDCLMYISSEGNYSTIVTRDNRKRLVCMQLGQIEGAISDQIDRLVEKNIIRLGRSLIINTDYIHFIDVARQELILSDCCGSYHELTASKEVLAKLKEITEKTD